VLELQDLHRPLDVGQAAGAQLDMTCGIGSTRQTLCLHACLETTDLSQTVVVQPVRAPAQRLHELLEGATELSIAGAGPGPQKRLALPNR